MAKTANELLHGILSTISKIEAKMGGNEKSKDKPKASNKIFGGLSGSLLTFGLIKDKTKTSFISFMKNISEIVEGDKGKNFDYFAEGMVTISNALPNFVTGLNELGRTKTKRVNKAIGTLRKLYLFMHEMGDGRKAKRVSRAATLFGKIGRALKKIAKPLRMISSFLLYLSAGILAFAGTLYLTSKILKLRTPKDALIFIGFTILSLVIMFGVLALARKIVDRGSDAIKDIGIGMITLAGGIIAFALTLKFLPMILGEESGGSIAGSLLTMMGIVAAAVGMFALMGLAAPLIKKGTTVVFMMSLGMVVLSAALVAMATAAKYLMGGKLSLGSQPDGEEKDSNKKMVLRGLGTMGLIVLASVGMFVLLGLAAIPILLGVGVSIAMSAALLVLSLSVSKMAKAAKETQDMDVKDTIKSMISSTIEGFLGGISSLSGKGNAIQRAYQFIKNSVKIFAAVGVLMSMSVALSMFAKAISAFAKIDNMRVIEGTDSKGEPIFGEKINVANVGANISTTISSFLEGLISSTSELESGQALKIKKMGRALTGKRGILSAVIQFASALKIYAEFGEKNEIGYISYDEEGNEVTKYVSADTVSTNMVNSFLYFTNKLFSRSEEEFGDGEPGISGRQRRRMKRMSKALVGKHGILGAVIQFAEVLKTFSKFGVNNELPILDADGNQTGTISGEQIAGNIVSTITSFSTMLTDKLGKLSKLSRSLDGLKRVSESINELGEGIGVLAVNVDKLNADKLTAIMKKTSAANIRPEYTSSSNSSSNIVNTQSTTASASKSERENWNEISQMIGQQVGANVVAAIKNGQFVFEFDTTKSGGVYYWNPS